MKGHIPRPSRLGIVIPGSKIPGSRDPGRFSQSQIPGFRDGKKLYF